MQTIDTTQDLLSPPSPKTYQKTEHSKLVCYRYDASKPQHCLEMRNCSLAPLQLENRITRSPNILVIFEGWFDPIPVGGTTKHTSSIQSYEIKVNEISVSNGIVKVNTLKKAVFSKTFNATETRVKLNISSDKPQLFCVTLEVKDVADNSRQARRFFLFDNSSSIKSRSDKPVYFSSASNVSNYIWQTHHNDICLKWKGHFYNEFYKKNKVLNRIETTPYGTISGIYEQTNGILPVNGTNNIDGIVQFMVSYSNNSNSNDSFSPEIEVTNVLSQSFCKQMTLKDGESYLFKIRAIDIVNNTFSEIRTVHIDRSVPQINNIWLVKDGYQRLYVHNQTDLSKMTLQFDAYDSHSAINTVEWFFGSSDFSDYIGSGSISVQTLNQV